MELDEKEKTFLIAVLKQLRFPPDAADNAVLARDLLKKLGKKPDESKP